MPSNIQPGTQVIRYRPYGSCRDILSDRSSEILFAGPTRCGKSLSLLWKGHLVAMRYAGARILLCRKTRQSMTQSVLVTFENEVLGPAHPSLLDRPCTRKCRNSYLYPNDSEIVVAGIDQPSRIMSSKYDLIFVFEGTELLEGDYRYLLTRLDRDKVPFSQVCVDCNPGSPRSWLKQRADKGLFKYYSGDLRDNPAMFDHAAGCWTEKGRDYKEKLSRLSGVDYQRLAEGKWVAAQGQIFSEFDQHIHVVDDISHLIFDRYYAAVDFGSNDPSTVLVIGQTRQGHLYIVREFYKTGASLEELAKLLKNWHAKYNFYTITCDCAARMIIEYLASHDIPCEPCTKGPDSIAFGIRLIKARLEARTLFYWRGALHQIDNRLQERGACYSLIGEFDAYAWKMSNDNPSDQPEDKHNHAIDALRYALMEIDGRGDGGSVAFSVGSMGGQHRGRSPQDQDND